MNELPDAETPKPAKPDRIVVRRKDGSFGVYRDSFSCAAINNEEITVVYQHGYYAEYKDGLAEGDFERLSAFAKGE